MKLKINKACDLSSISVLPPHARKTNAAPNGQQASQIRSQPSQQSFSQGLSSQHGMFSQLSQNSLDEVVMNDQRFASQEQENYVKKVSCLPMITCPREESQMPISRSSTNLMRKWNPASVPEYRCQISEDLEHRIGAMETSLNRLGMILDSVQSDVMQVNKGTKEVLLETEAVRQKLIAHDTSLQLMSKGQEDIKASLDGGLKSISVQLQRDIYQDKLQEIFLVLSALPERMEASLLKLKNELPNSFTEKMQAMSCNLNTSGEKGPEASILPPKVTGYHTSTQRKLQSLENPAAPPQVCVQANRVPKKEMRCWNSVKMEQATFQQKAYKKENKQKGISSFKQEREARIIIDSDEEINGGFSCLLADEGADNGNTVIEDAKDETERILRKARRRKRKYCKPIIID